MMEPNIAEICVCVFVFLCVCVLFCFLKPNTVWHLFIFYSVIIISVLNSKWIRWFQIFMYSCNEVSAKFQTSHWTMSSLQFNVKDTNSIFFCTAFIFLFSFQFIFFVKIPCWPINEKWSFKCIDFWLFWLRTCYIWLAL